MVICLEGEWRPVLRKTRVRQHVEGRTQDRRQSFLNMGPWPAKKVYFSPFGIALKATFELNFFKLRPLVQIWVAYAFYVSLKAILFANLFDCVECLHFALFHIITRSLKSCLSWKFGSIRTRGLDGKIRITRACTISQSDSRI